MNRAPPSSGILSVMVPPCHVCGTPNARFFAEKNGHKLYTCPHCKLLFVHPTPEDLAAIYNKEYFRNEGRKGSFGYTDYDKDKEPMRPVFEKLLLRLETSAPGRRIFDVGAATGYFLDIAKARGWETSGCELSPWGRSVAARRGHAMVEGEIATMDTLPQADAVTLWDVIEHVPEPRAMLRAVARMLPSGGVVMINTPDRASAWARLMGQRWHLIVPPEHLYYFSPKNLGRLLEESGFAVEEVAKIGKSFSPSYVFKTLAHWQGLEAWNVLARTTDNAFFRKFSLPINLRDNMFVLARKV